MKPVIRVIYEAIGKIVGAQPAVEPSLGQPMHKKPCFGMRAAAQTSLCTMYHSQPRRCENVVLRPQSAQRLPV